MLEPQNRLDALLADAVAEGVAPGLVAVVADEGSLLYEGAVGRRDALSDGEMTVDTIFRIASMTKLVTAISVLRLVERGLIDLETPVGDVLPAFDALDLLEGFDGDEPRLRRPRGRATVRQLLTHTSGLAYDIWNADLTRYNEVADVVRLQTGSREAFGMPLVSDPGSRFNYGTSMDWAGLLVEAVDGRRVERYWQEELFGPLGLEDTTPAPDAPRRARVAPVHARRNDGSWAPTEIDFARDPEVYAAGHCLYSTAHDFLCFQQALLRDGDAGPIRLLAPETVDDMFRNHIGALEVGTIRTADPPASADVPLGAKKWGLGILVEPEDVPGGRAAGSGGWMGGFNTFFWIDRRSGVTAALYAQTIPFYDDRTVELVRRFETAAYEAAATRAGGVR